jgi:LacI family transcriptional regulator
MTTIYDVAKRAGVSAASVSRFMNGHSVRADAATRIRAAVDDLKYSPSRTARSLRTATAQVIALIIPDIENPYFTAIARGAEDEARKAGYSLVLCNTDDSTETERQYVDVVLSENMAGAIVAPAGDGLGFSALISQDRPVVAVDRHIRGVLTDSVMIDNIAFGRRATQAMIDAGARRIACITGPQRTETARDRSNGWRSALGAGADEGLLRWSNFRVDGGRSAMRDLLDVHSNAIDAVVVTNNLMAVGVLGELRAAGRQPPAVRMAVLGDLPYMEEAIDGVKTYPLPAREIGTRAARLLLGRIGGELGAAETVVLAGE